MGQINLKVAETIDARAENVYATIADYREGHPRILPKGTLYDLQIEQGGYGADTIISFKSRVLGVEQTFYHRVSEPEPGHVLVEQDVDTPQQLATTFTVTSQDQGQKSQVEISTTLNASPGLRGLSERLVFALIMPRIYHKELKLLEEVAQKAFTRQYA